MRMVQKYQRSETLSPPPALKPLHGKKRRGRSVSHTLKESTRETQRTEDRDRADRDRPGDPPTPRPWCVSPPHTQPRVRRAPPHPGKTPL